MGSATEISWCDHTFNPWWGCERISPACALCYADREATRHGFPGQFVRQAPHREFGEAHWQEPRRWARKAGLEMVRRRAFCASMADVFEEHPTAEKWRPRLFELIAETDELDWLLLTKRPENALRMLPREWMRDGLPRNIWFGFSAESQHFFDERWAAARKVPAWIRFCSYEPALGPIDFKFPGVAKRRKPDGFDDWPAAKQEEVIEVAARAEHMARFEMIDWLIAGGESGLAGQPVRPSHPDWLRSARDQAAAAGVAFHFKQWGEWAPSAEIGFGNGINSRRPAHDRPRRPGPRLRGLPHRHPPGESVPVAQRVCRVLADRVAGPARGLAPGHQPGADRRVGGAERGERAGRAL